MINNSFNPLEENYCSTLMKNLMLFEEFNQIGQVRLGSLTLAQIRLGSLRLDQSKPTYHSMNFMIKNSFNPLQEEEENYWSTLMKNSTLFQEFNRTATPQELEIFDALREAQLIENSRPKRQAGFPGATSKKDNK